MMCTLRLMQSPGEFIASAQGRFLPVPWGGELVVQVMTLWVVAFYLLGCFVVPIALDLLDLERDDLSSRGQASLSSFQSVAQPTRGLCQSLSLVLILCLSCLVPIALNCHTNSREAQLRSHQSAQQCVAVAYRLGHCLSRRCCTCCWMWARRA